MTRFLLAVDDEPVSKAAAAYVKQLVKEGDEVLILAVASDPPTLAGGPFNSLEATVELSRSIREHMTNVAKGYRADLTQAGIKNTAYLGHGDVGECICSEAKRLKADIVMMGRRTNSLERTIWGSQSSYVVHNCPVAVFVVKSAPPEPAPKDKLWFVDEVPNE
jgi:nucleotide-binding universal stress UspA family protein